ncbi:hypothetical protein ACTA71_011838 [Dictyostelium dimigraforme]
MLRDFNFICIFILIINIASSQYIIKVNYNVERNYSSFEECGVDNQPVCTSLEDASYRAVLWFETISSDETVEIKIIGDINGSVPVSMGDIDFLCGTIYLRSDDPTKNITIDGSSSTQPFLTIREPDDPSLYYSCGDGQSYTFRNLNFINWNQTILDINIVQGKSGESLRNYQYIFIAFFETNFFSSSSIVKVYPKNFVNQEYSRSQILVSILRSYYSNLKPSNILAPNSTKDYLPPIYAIGTIIQLPTVTNSIFLTTPFIYIKCCSLSITEDVLISNNNFSNNPFMIIEDSVLNSFINLYKIKFDKNVMSTVVYFSQCPLGQVVSFKISNTIQPLHYQRRTYLNYQYENSLVVVKSSSFPIVDWFKLDAGTNNIIENDIYFIEKSSISIEHTGGGSSIPAKHLVNVINSSISLNSMNLTWNGFSIIGNNSKISQNNCITLNDTYCGCYNCSVNGHPIDTNSIQCINTTPTNTPSTTPTDTPSNTPTDTPTDTPTITSTNNPTNSSTNNPTNTPSILTESPITATKRPKETHEKSDKKRNIIIITVILGFKIKENLQAGAENERAVSPTIDLDVLYKHENDDRGQKEII